MRFGVRHGLELLIARSITLPQFAAEVIKFELELTRCNRNFFSDSSSSDLGSIEPVLTCDCFTAYFLEVGCDGSQRIGSILKSNQLGMMSISLRSSLKNFLGKETLTPKGNQAFGIKVAWMDGPESHKEFLLLVPA